MWIRHSRVPGVATWPVSTLSHLRGATSGTAAKRAQAPTELPIRRSTVTYVERPPCPGARRHITTSGLTLRWWRDHPKPTTPPCYATHPKSQFTRFVNKAANEGSGRDSRHTNITSKSIKPFTPHTPWPKPESKGPEPKHFVPGPY